MLWAEARERKGRLLPELPLESSGVSPKRVARRSLALAGLAGRWSVAVALGCALATGGACSAHDTSNRLRAFTHGGATTPRGFLSPDAPWRRLSTYCAQDSTASCADAARVQVDTQTMWRVPQSGYATVTSLDTIALVSLPPPGTAERLEVSCPDETYRMVWMGGYTEPGNWEPVDDGTWVRTLYLLLCPRPARSTGEPQ